MKSALLTLLLIYLVNQSDCDEEKYTTMYDGINLDEILANDRLLSGYVNCLLDVGPCTPDGKELKRNLPDAIEHDCGKCTQRQREGADQVMHYIIDHRSEDWEKLEMKYNSDGSYKRKYVESKKGTDDNTTNKPGDTNKDDDDDNNGNDDKDE